MFSKLSHLGGFPGPNSVSALTPEVHTDVIKGGLVYHRAALFVFALTCDCLIETE